MVFVFFYICKLAREQKNDVDGIHGVVSEGDIKARAMGQQMQVGVEDLATLALVEII